ncbi:MAG: hypothetical protein ACI4QX_03940 [Lachnospiraceae bacterium]
MRFRKMDLAVKVMIDTNNRLNEGKDLQKDGAEIEEKKRRRTVCTSSFFDDDSGAGFLQRFPEFKWFLV